MTKIKCYCEHCKKETELEITEAVCLECGSDEDYEEGLKELTSYRNKLKDMLITFNKCQEEIKENVLLRNKLHDIEIENKMLKASALNKEVIELRKELKETQKALNIALEINNKLRKKLKQIEQEFNKMWSCLKFEKMSAKVIGYTFNKKDIDKFKEMISQSGDGKC